MELGIFVKQYKGKDLGKVPKSKLLTTGWNVGIKFDGNYIQIHKKDSVLFMFTSSGEQMFIEELAEELEQIDFDFIIEAEFNNNSNGLTLNDRRKSSTGTARANFKKGFITSYPKCQIRVFDVLYTSAMPYNSLTDEVQFKDRQFQLESFNFTRVRSVVFRSGLTLEQAQEFARGLISQGGEGAFAFHDTHTVKAKGRSNLAIKLKADNNAKMICVGAQESDTVDGEWGALELQDEDSNIQFFGGLPNSIRTMYPKIPMKEVFDVRYESFTDGKYIQGFVNVK